MAQKTDKKMSADEVRDHVRSLKHFYRDVVFYVVMNIALILIWAISGGGYFWPIWVIVGWGLSLGMRALHIGIFPHLQEMLPFMKDEWEENKIKEMMDKKN